MRAAPEEPARGRRARRGDGGHGKSMSPEAHGRARQAPDGAARGAAPPPERDATIDAHHHLFGSNFPVDSLYGDYDTLVDAYRAITAPFTPGERRALFHDNAQRFYRL